MEALPVSVDALDGPDVIYEAAAVMTKAEQPERALEAVQPGLLNMVLSGAITKPESYMKLVRKEDGEEYDPNKFQEARIQNYRFVVVTSARYPEQPMVDALKPFRINIRSK